MNECLIFDYQDSFTYNISSEMQLLGVKTTVIPFENIQKTYEALLHSNEKKILIHGPGPGHPEDYQFVFNDLKKILLKNNFFHLGICLGHQLLMTIQGGVISESFVPMHGRKVNVTIPEWNIFNQSHWGKTLEIQRYNSLALRKTHLSELQNLSNFQYVVEDDDVLMTYQENQLTYQFHPESVGTSCPFIFFEGPRSFLYN